MKTSVALSGLLFMLGLIALSLFCACMKIYGAYISFNALSCLLFMLGLIALSLFCACMEIYGAYLSFKKKWYMGAVALLIPGFALVVGVSKAIFKKDILV